MPSTETIKKLYAAFRENDYEAFKILCSADIEWVQNDGFPNGGRHKGADAIIKNVFQQFKEDWILFKFQQEEIFESKDGSQVVVLGYYEGKYKATQKTMKASAAHIYDLAEGKVTRFRQFTDTAIIASAIR